MCFLKPLVTAQTLLALTELATIVAFGKHTPDHRYLKPCSFCHDTENIGFIIKKSSRRSMGLKDGTTGSSNLLICDLLFLMRVQRSVVSDACLSTASRYKFLLGVQREGEKAVSAAFDILIVSLKHENTVV